MLCGLPPEKHQHKRSDEDHTSQAGNHDPGSTRSFRLALWLVHSRRRSGLRLDLIILDLTILDFDIRNKTIPPCWDGLNVAGVPGIVCQSLPQLGYSAAENIFRNKGVLPDCIEQFALLYKTAPVFKQENQYLQGFRLHGYSLP